MPCMAHLPKNKSEQWQVDAAIEWLSECEGKSNHQRFDREINVLEQAGRRRGSLAR